MAIAAFDQNQLFQLPNGGSVTYQLPVITQGGALSIAFLDPSGSGGGEQVWVTLTDAAGNTLFSLPTATSQTFTATVPGAGNYFVTIADLNPGDNHNYGTYTINPHIDWQAGTVYDGPLNNSMQAALAAPLGADIVGTLTSGDVDVFRINSTQAGLLHATFGHPSGKSASGAAIKVDLLDAQGNVITTKTLASDAAFDATLAGSGDFYLRVSDASAPGTTINGFYTFDATLAAQPGEVYDGAADTDAAHAQPLPLARELVGEMHKGDVDYYALNLSSAGTFSLNFLHPGGPSLTGASLGVQLIGPAGNVVLSQTVSTDSDFSVNVPAAGQYTLQVTQPASATGDAGIYRLMTAFSNAGGVTSRGGTTDANFTSTAGNDTFFGYSGRDSVTFHDVRAHYTVLGTDAGVAVTSTSGVDGSDTLFGIDRLYFSDKIAIALDWNGSAGEAYRVYQAAFDRTPDSQGLGFWIYQHDRGMTLTEIANGFVQSAEFHQVYGDSPTSTDIVTKFYEHVLHRAPDPGGIDFWVKELDQGLATVADVLVDFSRSQENFDLLVGVAKGFEYKVWG